MRIIINGRFLLHRVTGVERYARELVSALDELAKPGQCEIAVPPEVEEIPPWQNIAVRRVGKLHNRLWEHISFPAYVRSRGGIALNLCNVSPLPEPGISTVHDMKPIVHPEYYSRKFVLWYRLLFANELRRSRMILTGSRFSAREIVRYYYVDPGMIHLIPEGWQHFERIGYDPYALERYGLKKGAYWFSMGSRDPGKNLKWIIESARRHPEEIYAVSGNVNSAVFSGMEFSGQPGRNGSACRPDKKVIRSAFLKGEKDRTPAPEKSAEVLENSPEKIPVNVRFLGYVTDEEAKTLMRDCRAFLFPTFYEGFGLPPLEALSAGCPCVVVSDIPVMHEIFGDEAVYIDPHAVGDFTCRQADREKILAKYSWKRSAEKLWKILEREYQG